MIYVWTLQKYSIEQNEDYPDYIKNEEASIFE